MEQHDPCRHACLRPLQLDLFGREPLDPTPVWTEIPAETRQELTGLVTRMLLECVRPAKQGGRTDDA